MDTMSLAVLILLVLGAGIYFRRRPQRAMRRIGTTLIAAALVLLAVAGLTAWIEQAHRIGH